MLCVTAACLFHALKKTFSFVVRKRQNRIAGTIIVLIGGISIILISQLYQCYFEAEIQFFQETKLPAASYSCTLLLHAFFRQKFSIKFNDSSCPNFPLLLIENRKAVPRTWPSQLLMPSQRRLHRNFTVPPLLWPIENRLFFNDDAIDLCFQAAVEQNGNSARSQLVYNQACLLNQTGFVMV